MVATFKNRHYTPSDLATTLVAAVCAESPKVIVDLAAGGGSLLLAAARRWPGSKFVGVDIDDEALRCLHQEIPSATCLHQDALGKLKISGKVDVAILNPPFSYRGGTFWLISDGVDSHRCSQAMAFLFKAVEVVKDHGEVVALMPRNSLRSERDAAAWKLLFKKCEIRLCGHFGRNTFEGCFPSVVIVHVRKCSPNHVAPSLPDPPSEIGQAFLYRGTLAVSRSKGDCTTDLLHTIHLAKGRCTSLRCEPSPADLTGYVVLLPRVGACHPEHLALRHLHKPTRLSECVFAIWGRNEVETRKIYRTLKTNFERFEAIYHGTCARYITVAELTAFLTGLGFRTAVVRPETSPVQGTAVFAGFSD